MSAGLRSDPGGGKAYVQVNGVDAIEVTPTSLNFPQLTPTDGDALVYDAATGTWGPGAVSGGGGYGGGDLNLDADAHLQIRSETGAYVQIDSRGDNAVIHKWSRDSSDAVYQPYTESWYDGSSYFDLTASSGRLVLVDGNMVIVGSRPWFTLDSTSSGDNALDQGAGLSIGESGERGSAALHLTYTGDGRGHIGMGSVGTDGRPANQVMELYYVNKEAKFLGGIVVEGSTAHVYNGIQASTANSGHIMLDSTGTGNAYVNWHHSGGVFLAGGGGHVNLQDGTGKVGVGTRSPVYDLDVRGILRVTSRLIIPVL